MNLPEIQQYPKYEEICQYHCAEYQSKIQVFTVYMDLAESKGWWNLKIEDNSKLGCTLISGHPSVTADRDYVLPVRSQSSLSHAEIQEITQTVREDYKSDSVILAITDDNSSIVYYEASGTLCPPNPTDTVELKQAKNRRIFERKRASMLQLREEAKHRKTETVDSSKAEV